MKPLSLFLFLVLYYPIFINAQSKELYSINENGLFGFMDETGKVIIQPKFKKVYEFSEGLASVCLNGKYGYINESGDFVIDAKYDIATSFDHGIATVYNDGKAYLINKSGKIILNSIYNPSRSLYEMEMANERLYVKTNSGKEGVLNLKTRKLIVDTMANSLSDLKNGVYIAYINDKKLKNKHKYAIIDSLGKIIVPFDKYETIERFTNEYFLVTLKKKRPKDPDTYYIIDINETIIGKKIFYHLSPYLRGPFDEGFSNGLAVVMLDRYLNDEKKELHYSQFNDKLNYAYMNSRGEIVFKDTLGNELKDFYNNRAFLQVNNNQFKMIDLKFTRVGDISYDEIMDQHFKGNFLVKMENKVAMIDTNARFIIKPEFDNISFEYDEDYIYVESDKKWGILDSTGQFIIKPEFEDVPTLFSKNKWFVKKNNKYGIINSSGNFILKPQFDSIFKLENDTNYILYSVGKKTFKDPWECKTNVEKRANELFVGLADTRGNLITDPIMEFGSIRHEGFETGLLKANVNNRRTHIDKYGNIVWQEKLIPNTDLKPIDIDFKLSGYFKKQNENIGVIDSSLINSLNSFIDKSSNNELKIIVNTQITDTFRKEYEKIEGLGYVVNLLNFANKKFSFSAQDNRLYMNVQAKDINGNWKDIEYLPSSFCGNSYHSLKLEKKHYWSFITPVYTGSYKTKLRIKLCYYSDASNPNQNIKKTFNTMYSNEYEGAINPTQFWNKHQYYQPGFRQIVNDAYYEARYK